MFHQSKIVSISIVSHYLLLGLNILEPECNGLGIVVVFDSSIPEEESIYTLPQILILSTVSPLFIYSTNTTDLKMMLTFKLLNISRTMQGTKNFIVHNIDLV